MKFFTIIRQGVNVPKWLPLKLRMLCELSESKAFRQGESRNKKSLTERTAQLCSGKSMSSRMLLRKRQPGCELKNKKRYVKNVPWNKNKSNSKCLRSISICKRNSKLRRWMWRYRAAQPWLKACKIKLKS